MERAKKVYKPVRRTPRKDLLDRTDSRVTAPRAETALVVVTITLTLLFVLAVLLRGCADG